MTPTTTDATNRMAAARLAVTLSMFCPSASDSPGATSGLLGDGWLLWEVNLLQHVAVSLTTQQSKTNQHNSLRSRWSSSTSSLISAGSWARCHWHSRRPASRFSPSGDAARAALMA